LPTPLRSGCRAWPRRSPAGAEFIQTQCIYNLDKFEEWMAKGVGPGPTEKVFILAGMTPMKSAGMAKYMKTGCRAWMYPMRWSSAWPGRKGKTGRGGHHICVESIQRLKEVEGVAGFHVMAIEWEEKVPENRRARRL
jgi:methylenetetrahydrofolate reductase (NADPH)